jgi:hypothetical protein
MTRSDPPLILASFEQIAAMLREVLEQVLADQREDPACLLLDRNGIAKALGCSPSQIDRLRRLGMPFIRLGDVPRFELARCLEWLRQRQDDDPTDA